MSDETFRCCQCDGSFSEQSARDEHFKETHLPIDLSTTSKQNFKFGCNFCFQRFEDELSLFKHLRVTDNFQAAMHVCSLCGLEFSSHNGLEIHKSRIHAKEKQFKCTEAGCTKVFAKKRNLQNHINNKHIKNRLICDICQQSFGYKSVLREHMNTHKTVKSFVCSFCKKAFQQSVNLHRHIRDVHTTTERRFKCQICSLTFSRNSGMQRHFDAMHSQIRPIFKCKFCASDFTTKSYCKVHEEKRCPNR